MNNVSRNLTWREALEMQIRREQDAKQSHSDAVNELGEELRKVTISEETVSKDRTTVSCTGEAKEFYSSKVRCKTALQNCNVKELQRIVEVATEMIGLLTEERKEQETSIANNLKLQRLYEENVDGWKLIGINSFLDFLKRL